jgi:DNA-binding protein HU-beta
MGTAKKETQNVVNSFIEEVSNCRSKGDKVTLVSFGIFQVMKRKARRGALQISAKKVPTFRPGKRLKEKVKWTKIAKIGPYTDSREKKTHIEPHTATFSGQSNLL